MLIDAWSGETELKNRFASANTDGIKISVATNKESHARTNVTCSITNHSPYILASIYPHSESLCFRINMKDFNDKDIPLEEKWALINAHSNGLNNSEIDRRGLKEIYIRPEKSYDFHFYLEDAFGERAKDGKELEVKWMNFRSETGTMLRFEELKHLNGTVTPAYQEENHFPGLRVFAVKLPLTHDSAASENEPTSSVPAQSQTKSTEESAIQVRPQDRKPLNVPSAFDARWLSLLLLPVLFLLFRSLRSNKFPWTKS